MGQTLSSPETKKKTESGGNDRYLYAVTEMQGWRISMEDAHAAMLDFDGEPNSNGFFAVYDGHGGGRVSKYAGENLHKRLLSEEKYHEKNYDAALKRAFLGTDEDLLATRERDTSGATAVAALLADNKIYVANAGDSRSVIGIKGEAQPLSFDHKPTNESERARICAAGGYIDFGRVNGNLALSRALGDFEFKKNNELAPEKQIITADPDVICHEVTEEDEFLVIACDGIWDCLSSQQVIDIVRYEISEGKGLGEITELICDHCLAPDTTSRVGIGCDNMTVLVVAILHGRTKEEWYSWIADRVKNQYGYETPSALPQLYSPSRLMSFRARQEALEARNKSRQEEENSIAPAGNLNAASAGIARILGSTGGISFSPGSSIFSDHGTLMFTGDDSDDEDPGDVKFLESDVLLSDDPTRHLKAQFAEFEKDMQEDHGKDRDGDTEMRDSNLDETPHKLQGETPPSPKPLPNGDSKSLATPAEQLHSQPGGDEPASVAKIEGLLDASEDPFKI
ncbi:PP2C domain containing protein [Amanita muscaria]